MAADGYTWFKISGPLETWAPAEPVRGDVWVAGRQGTTTFVGPRTAPNTTIVAAGLARLTFGAGGPASIGASQAATAARAFSPNGDGSEDRLTLRWTNGLAFDSLMLRVFRSNGSLVGTRAVTSTGSGAQAWAWDGSLGGHRLVDGRYAVQLVGRAGGRTYTAPSVRPLLPAQVTAYAITIDTVRPKLTGATIGGRLISPPRDGRHDAVRLAGSSTGATRWRLTAAPVSGGAPGAPIRTIGGAGGRPRTSWDGRTDTGRPAADGRYRLTLAVLDPAGNFAARSWDVAVDGTPPTLATSAEPVVDLAERRRQRRCRRHPLGRARSRPRCRSGSSTAPGSCAPSPVTPAPRPARPAGTAAGGRGGSWQMASTSSGSRPRTRPGTGGRCAIPIRVDRTAGWLRWAPSAFYPQDLDALARTARATFKLGRAATTSLAVVDAKGDVVRSAWSGRRRIAGAVGWTWDGRTGSGSMVGPGTYRIVLTARSGAGTTTLRQPIVVDAFAIATSSTRPRLGRPLVVTIRSTEALSSRPVVTLDQTGRPPVRRFATQVGPGRFTVRFTLARTGSGPASIKVSATDRAGRRNASVRWLTVR